MSKARNAPMPLRRSGESPSLPKPPITASVTADSAIATMPNSSSFSLNSDSSALKAIAENTPTVSPPKTSDR